MKAGLLIFTAGPSEALELARQLGAYPMARDFATETSIAHAKLNMGETVVAAGVRGLVTGWHAPENTVVTFTDSFVERNPPQSAYYQQARLRARPRGL